jgi:hypothetical protein
MSVRIEPDLLDVRTDSHCGCQISRKCIVPGCTCGEYKRAKFRITPQVHGFLVVIPCQACLVLWVENEVLSPMVTDRHFKTQRERLTEEQKKELTARLGVSLRNRSLIGTGVEQ